MNKASYTSKRLDSLDSLACSSCSVVGLIEVRITQPLRFSFRVIFIVNLFLGADPCNLNRTGHGKIAKRHNFAEQLEINYTFIPVQSSNLLTIRFL